MGGFSPCASTNSLAFHLDLDRFGNLINSVSVHTELIRWNPHKNAPQARMICLLRSEQHHMWNQWKCPNDSSLTWLLFIFCLICIILTWLFHLLGVWQVTRKLFKLLKSLWNANYSGFVILDILSLYSEHFVASFEHMKKRFFYWYKNDRIRKCFKGLVQWYPIEMKCRLHVIFNFLVTILKKSNR